MYILQCRILLVSIAVNQKLPMPPGETRGGYGGRALRVAVQGGHQTPARPICRSPPPSHERAQFERLLPGDAPSHRAAMSRKLRSPYERKI